MKKISIIKNVIIFAAIISFFGVGPVYAQATTEIQNPEDLDSEVKIQDVEGLRLSLEQKLQNPGSKNITFELNINSEITSDRVQIRWNVEGVSEVVAGETYEQFTLSTGQSLRKTLTIKPRVYGVTRVRVIVEAFEIDGTRVATASKALFSDAKGNLLGAEGGQQAANILYLVQQSLIVILTLFILVVGGVFIYRSFYKWVKSD